MFLPTLVRWERLLAAVPAPRISRSITNRTVSIATGVSGVMYLFYLGIRASSQPPTFEEATFVVRAVLVVALAVWLTIADRFRTATDMEQRQGRIVEIIATTLVVLLSLVIWLEPLLYREPARILAWLGLAIGTLIQIKLLARLGWVHLAAALLLLGGIMQLIASSNASPTNISTAFTHIIVILIAGLLIRWWAGLVMALLIPALITTLQHFGIAAGTANWASMIESALLLSTIAALVTLYAYSLEHALDVAQTRATHLSETQRELQTVITQQETRIAAAVQALAEREAYFRSLVQHSSDVITIVGADGTLREHGPALSHVFGFDPSALSGIPLDAWVHPDDRPTMRRFLTAIVAEPGRSARIEWRLRHHNTSYLHVESIGTNLLLDPNVGAIVLNSRDLSERMALTDQLSYQAFHDALTHLPNRTLFMDRLNHALAQTKRTGTQVAVLFLDLDRFKVINDSLGHDVGDQLLIAVAERLQACIRPCDTAARLGGDEFTVLLEDVTCVTDVTHVAERIQTMFREPVCLGQQNLCVTTSIGIALSERDADHPTELLRRADVAMYEAKHGGRAGFAVFTNEMNARAVERLALEHDLRAALERHEFELAYQPVVDLVTGEIVGMEALLRWQHPERGQLSPALFVPLAEETGLIVPIGRWVLETACREASAWAKLSAECAPMIAVNLSVRQMERPEFVAEVAELLRMTGLPAARLKLEITERLLMQDVPATQRTLHALKALGACIAVDDFGTEYSSLSYLKRFPIDILKIDRAFVSELAQDRVDQAIVQALITLDDTLKVDVIAEGVETAAQVNVLRELGCRWAQGYYFGRPSAVTLPHESIVHAV